MPETALSQLESPDSRNELIPLPHDEPVESHWGRIADVIAQQYLAEFPPSFSRGRPHGLSEPDGVAAMLQAVDNGLTDRQAAVMVGISETTLIRWLDLAEKQPDTAFGAFRSALKTAREQRRQRLLQRIAKAGLKDQHWPANAWLLERGYGNDYKLNQDKQAAQVVVNVGIISASDIQIGGESVGHNSLPDVVIPSSD